MTHEAAREKLLDLACGELPGREAARVEAHAAGCDACRAELAELRATRRLMAGLGELPAPSRGEAELLAAARVAAAGSAARPRPWRLPAWFLGASAVAATLVTVTAVSYRLLTAAPARRDDPEGLLGRGAVSDGSAPQAAASRPADGGSTAAPAAPSRGVERGEVAGAPSREADRGANAAAPLETRAPAAPAAPAPPSPPAARAAPAPSGSAFTSSRKASPATAPKDAAEEPRALTLRAPEAPGGRDAAPASEAGPSPAASSASVGIAEAPAARRRAAEAPEPAPAAPAKSSSTDAAPARAARADEAPERRAQAAPPSAAPAAPAPAQAATPRAALAGARPSAEAGALDAVTRWRSLRAAGQLRREVATFPDCPGESWREVETDPQGRVARYTRRGRAGGAPFEAELYYGAGGALEVVRYREAQGPWRELRPPDDAPVGAGPIPAAALEPRRADEARVDARPRCRG